MRIAFVVHDYDRTHGHSRYVAALAERYCRDHDVHVYANRFDGPIPSGITPHHVPAWRASALSTILTYPPAARSRLREQYDIVHAQGLVVGRADVITAHICNAKWADRPRIDGSKGGWRERLFAGVVVPMERRLYRSPGTVVIAVSDALRRDLERYYGRRGETVVIHHGVDRQQFHPGVRALRGAVRARLGVASTEPVFLFVGDLRKGASEAIAAMPEVSGRLVLVSRSDPLPWLAEARRRGVADRVTALPPTDCIEEYYAAADVFCFPTPYDAFGLVITEAMACGLPVITTRQAGAAELIEDGKTGILLDGHTDHGRLATAMRRLAADEALRRRLGDAAATAMAAHDWDHVAARTFAVYERIAAARQARCA